LGLVVAIQGAGKVFLENIISKAKALQKGSILHYILIMNITKISNRNKYLSLNKEKVPIYSFGRIVSRLLKYFSNY